MKASFMFFTKDGNGKEVLCGALLAGHNKKVRAYIDRLEVKVTRIDKRTNNIILRRHNEKASN